VIRLRDKDSGSEIGTITDDELQFLVDQLEEEYDEDRDYYIAAPLIDVLEQNGADADVIKLLRASVGDRDGIEIEWSRE
jgi:hypothetical protein